MTEPRPVLLEQRYRFILRVLPASYRAEREEEMVAAFMEMSGEVPDERNPRPRWGEIASVAALSVRVRLGGAGAGPRSMAWGETVRLVALIGLGYHAAVSAYGFGLLAEAVTGRAGDFLSPVHVALVLLEFLWIVAFAAAGRGHARHAKTAALVASGASLSWIVTGGLPDEWPESAAVLLVVVPVLALLAGFHGDVPQTVRPWWLAALPVAVAVPLYGVFQSLARTPEVAVALWPWVEPGGGVAVVAVLGAGAVVLARRRSPAASLALAVCGTLLLAWRLPLGYPLEGNEALWVPSAAQCVLLASVIVPLLVTGWRGLPAARRAEPEPAL